MWPAYPIIDDVITSGTRNFKMPQISILSMSNESLFNADHFYKTTMFKNQHYINLYMHVARVAFAGTEDYISIFTPSADNHRINWAYIKIRKCQIFKLEAFY